MSNGQIQQVQRLVESHLEAGLLGALPDDQLLERFACGRDEAAFTALVRRHGPMVLGVCRSMLRNTHDAEDAFQAAFLVLACKARQIRRRDSLGGFLYGTACRVALKARARASRRQVVERATATATDSTRQLEEKWVLSEWLHDELGRLPEKYRQVLVLCHLEGKTQDQAAQELSCPAGSISRHLKRGEELLRERLTRRGAVLSTAALVAVLAERGQAAVSAELVRSTLQTAVLHAAGNITGATAGPAVALAREVLQSMARYHLHGLAAALLLGVIAVGATLTAVPQPAVSPPPDGRPRAEDGPAKRGDEDKGAKDRRDDALPTGAVSRLGSSRLRQGGQIRAMAYSPDGKLLASVGDDAVLRVWSCATGKELGRFPGQLTHSNSLAFSPDGKTVASVGADQAILLLDLAQVSHEAQTPLPLGPARLRIPWEGSNLALLGFVADGKTLLAAGSDGRVSLWTATEGAKIRTFRDVDAGIHLFALAPDGKTLAVAGPKKAVTVWDVETGQQVAQMPGQEQVASLAFSPDGKRLAAGIDKSDDIRLWDVANRKEIRSFTGKKEPPLSSAFGTIAQSVGFTPDGKTLVSLGCLEDDKLRVWDVASGKELQKFRGGRGDGGLLALSPDGRVAAVTGVTNRVRMWELKTGKELHTEQGMQGRVESLAVSPDSRLVALGSFDGVVRLYERDTGREVRSFPAEKHSISDLTFSPDGKQLLVAVAYHPARLWDLATGKEVRSFPGALGSVRGVYRTAFAPDGALLAMVVPEPGVQIIDPATGKLVRKLLAKPSGDHIAFSPDGTKLAAGGFGKALNLWDVASGKEEWLARNADPILTVAFSPNGKWVTTGDGRNAVKFWEAATGAFVRQLEGPGGTIRDVAFSPDGRLLACSGDTHDVFLYEIATGTVVRTLTGHGGLVWKLAFSPDGQTLITGSFDATALVWDITGRGFVKKRAAPLSDADLEHLWDAMGEAKGNEAYSAVWEMIHSPKQAVPFLDKKLHPGPLPDAKTMSRLLANLDDDKFAVREKASAALAALGKAVEPDLKEALAMKGSVEVQERLAALLKKLGQADDRLRGLRVITVLEYAAAPDALELMKHLANKGQPEELRPEAEAALKRIKGRQAGPGQ
jgi:RNA polymerase sigma factor (sigma-70 family)